MDVYAEREAKLDNCLLSLQDCNIPDGQEILREGTSSTGAQGGSDSDASESNLLSPTNDVTSNFAPMSLANSGEIIFLPPPSTSPVGGGQLVTLYGTTSTSPVTPVTAITSPFAQGNPVSFSSTPTYYSDSFISDDKAERGLAGSHHRTDFRYY
jgi:hypothetical protein